MWSLILAKIACAYKHVLVSTHRMTLTGREGARIIIYMIWIKIFKNSLLSMIRSFDLLVFSF